MIGMVMEAEILSLLHKCHYISVLSDVSTDVGNLEKELIYVTFISDAVASTRLLAIRDVKHAGLMQLLLDVFFEWADIDVKKKLVGFCADWASVNIGRVGGVAVRLAREVKK